MPIELYQASSFHSEDQLILYLPNEHLIYTTDFYNVGGFNTSMPIPSPALKQRALELLGILQNLGLTNGNNMISGHGPGMMTFEEFEAHANL